MSLAQKIYDALGGCGSEYGSGGSVKMEVTEIRSGFQICYSDMYEAPSLGFAKLQALSQIFGTNEIDVDNWSTSGCDTCDYGSCYAHDIQIYNPTKNAVEMKLLVGKDVVKVLK